MESVGYSFQCANHSDEPIRRVFWSEHSAEQSEGDLPLSLPESPWSHLHSAESFAPHTFHPKFPAKFFELHIKFIYVVSFANVDA